MYSKNHLLSELNELKEDYAYKRKLLGGYRQQLRHQRSEDVDTKMKLENQIKETQGALNQLDLQISSLQKKIASINKPSQTDFDDSSFEENQEKIQIRVSLDKYSFQIPSDGYREENTQDKAYATLQKLRSAQKADSRVPDGLKDDDRKIYKKGKYGEQILLKEDDPIFADDILESRPDAVKG